MVARSASDVARQDDFDEILTTTVAMLEKAQLGSWSEVQRLASVRQHLLQAFFSVTPDPRETPYLAAGIKRLLDLNACLTGLGEAERDRIAGRMSELRTRQRAQRAYGGGL